MSLHRILFSLLLLFAISPAVFADTIHFKNGTFVTVDKAVENGANVDYFIGGHQIHRP